MLIIVKTSLVLMKGRLENVELAIDITDMRWVTIEMSDCAINTVGLGSELFLGETYNKF